MKTNTAIPLLAGVLFLCACSGPHKDKEAADTTASLEKSVNPTARKRDTAPDAVVTKLVKKADIRFKVKSVQQTGENIAQLTASLGGMVVHHTVNSTSNDSATIKRSYDSVMKVTVVNTAAEMTVRIPPASTETFLLQVSKMGLYINNSHMDITDKSLDYLSTQLKLKNQREYADKQKTAESPKNADEMLAFKNSMVDQQINNRKTDDSVKYSTIALNFYESNVISREIVANEDLTAYNPPFFKQIGMSIQNGWDVFVSILVFVANAWVLLPLAALTFLLIRYIKKKRPIPQIKG